MKSSKKSSEMHEIAERYFKENYNMDGLELDEGVVGDNSYIATITYVNSNVKVLCGQIILGLADGRVVFATPLSIVAKNIRRDLLRSVSAGTYCETDSFGWWQGY